MYLSAYHFDGDATALVEAYDRMRAAFPPDTLTFHACVITGDGITVFDACPSRADFVAFSTGPDFRDVIAAAGLPTPRIEPLGDVHAAEAASTLREATAR